MSVQNWATYQTFGGGLEPLSYGRLVRRLHATEILIINQPYMIRVKDDGKTVEKKTGEFCAQDLPQESMFTRQKNLQDPLPYIYRIIYKMKTVVCDFLHIEEAFDNTPHDAVKETMNGRGIYEIASKWKPELLSTVLAEMRVGIQPSPSQRLETVHNGGIATISHEI